VGGYPATLYVMARTVPVVPKLWHGLRRLERHELTWLVLGLGACLALWAFIALAGEVMDGDTQALDSHILLALRSPLDPSRPRGPAWLEPAMLDLTSIGGPWVLGLVVVAVVGFLFLQTRYHSALVVLITSISGEFVNQALKNVFQRPRPAIVPHLRAVIETSFPSGHAMESAIIYLTLGAMLMRLAESRMTKAYCLVMAIVVTLLVGISRVYLGVHYPTDVIGGWIFGFVWASLCWIVARRFERETGVAQERRKVD
jgi:undecaprenyl-diphosphatase